MSNPAEYYESHTVPAVHARFIPSLLAAAEPQPGERVLDVGCGTGIAARPVVAHVRPHGEVTGLDPSADMLAVARRIADQDDLEIDWVQASAEELPFPSETFDLVLCQQVLQFVQDRASAIRDMYRVLRDGGRLTLHVMCGIEHHPFEMRLGESTERHLGTPVIGDIYALGDENTLRRLLGAAGFRDIEIEVIEIETRFPDPDRYIARRIMAASSAIPRMQALTDEDRTALIANVERELSDLVAAQTRDDVFIDPNRSHLVYAAR